MLTMRKANGYKGLKGDLSFPWFSGDTPTSVEPSVTSTVSYPTDVGTNWSGIVNPIASAAASITKSLTPLFAASSLQSGQSMLFNPTTGQYVISAGSLPLSLSTSGGSALSGWLPIVGLGLVAILGIKALSGK